MIEELLGSNGTLWALSRPELWQEPTLFQRLTSLILWDGLALLVFGGIICLGLRFYHAKLALMVASCIPLSSIAIWAGHTVSPETVTVMPFLMPVTYLIMAIGAFMAMMPIEFV